MASAFHAPYVTKASLESLDLKAGSPTSSMMGQDDLMEIQSKEPEESSHMSETEDEEVKMNCIGGVQAYMTTSDEDDFEDDEESCCSDSEAEDDEEERPLNFVARHICQAPEICRPRAMLGRIEEVEESSDSDASSTSSEEIEEAAVEVGDPGSVMSEEDSSEADDEKSGDEDSDDEDDGDDDENDEASASSDDLPISHSFTSRPVTPVEIASQGTPEVRDEDDSRFFDYENHCIDIIDKVLALDASTATQILSTDSAPSPRSKRILSCLFADDDDSSLDFHDTPKRMRGTLSTKSPIPPMTNLFLGPSAYDYEVYSEKDRESNVSPFSEQEQDRQLSEELQETELVNNRESYPVPLLSPPPSPLCVESDKGQLTTVCEWPSNLAIDSALTMITGLRAHSPDSLARLDLEEEDRFGTDYQSLGEGTSLTPLLKGIQMNPN